MAMLSALVLLLAVVLLAQSLFSLYLMLYTWEHPERLVASRGPSVFRAARTTFTVLLPARHEELVIYETIRRVLAARYPEELLEVVVVCASDDSGTIGEARRAIREVGSERVRVETFDAPPINKPHGLNVGYARSTHEVVTIFDAEDDIDPDIFNVVNTVFLEEGVGIVQAGVQLMNLHDHWFSVHNCMEYFFWFKSRLHFHARLKMVPLGGNTVFIRRELIARVGGWDEACLTEDADIGVRLSVLGEPIRVVYDAQHVTREETPESLGQLIRQRTRWHQGFLQVLRKGAWLGLPGVGQRLLALYTFVYPLVQALLLLTWPLTVVSLLWLHAPVPVVMVSFLPLYALALQYLLTVGGTYQFCRDYGLRFPVWLPVQMAVTFVPYQWVQGVAAVRAVYREVRGQGNWEKTAHRGAHRQPVAVGGPAWGRMLELVMAQLGMEWGSVLLQNPSGTGYSAVLSRGVPDALAVQGTQQVSAEMTEWVGRTHRPLLLEGQRLPADVRSGVVLPIEQAGLVVAQLYVRSARQDLDDRSVQEAVTLLAALAEQPGSGVSAPTGRLRAV